MPDHLTPEQRQARSDRYADLSRLKLHQAQQELDQGDTAQASEKAYGALTNAAKACGELRGWNHYNHHRTGLILTQLSQENNAPDLVVADMACSAQHSNYFEHQYDSTEVQIGIDIVAAACAKLESIRQQPIPPAPDRNSLSAEDRRRLTLLNQPPDEIELPVERMPAVPRPEDL